MVTCQDDVTSSSSKQTSVLSAKTPHNQLPTFANPLRREKTFSSTGESMNLTLPPLLKVSDVLDCSTVTNTHTDNYRIRYKTAKPGIKAITDRSPVIPGTARVRRFRYTSQSPQKNRRTTIWSNYSSHGASAYHHGRTLNS